MTQNNLWTLDTLVVATGGTVSGTPSQTMGGVSIDSRTIAKDDIIHYEYNFKGQKYQYLNRIKKNTYAQTLKQGQQVKLLAHEKTPHIAFIKNIYLEYI